MAVLVAAGLIVLRSFVFLYYEQADFDADQAIVGLMATHLAEGRAWPLFFYGQLYMLGVQAWMAALVFLASPPTVFGLKLPLLILNVATAGLLIRLLVRDSRLAPWQAWLASSWFIVVPPLTASRFVQAQGGTIEPLFYGLLLWMLRRRPVAFGALFALGFLQREFTLFPAVAVLALDAWTGDLRDRRRLAHWLVVLLVFLGARQAVTLARHTASMFGPDTAPPRLEDGVTNVDVLASSVCLSPDVIAGNVAWLSKHNVPTFFGVRVQPAGAFIGSSRVSGVPWAAVPLVVALLAAVSVIVGRARALLPASVRGQPTLGFPVFLLLTGLLGLAGVAAGCNVRSIFTIRYHLLLALAPVGLTALAFVLGVGDAAAGSPEPRRSTGARLRVMSAGVLVWAAAMTWSHVQLLHEYLTHPPPSPFRMLADDLVAHGDRHGWASYWVSYHVDFLTRERVQLSPTGPIRITEYMRQAFAAGPRATVVGNDACAPSDRHARKVLDWWVCRRD